MTDFRMRLIIETILKDEKLLRQLKKDLEGLEDAGKKGKKGFDFIKGVGKKIAVAAAAVAAFGVAANKAFNLTKEGAQVTDLANSFELMIEQAGAAPDLLFQLKEAAHGTVSEFELMASTMTLVMGTTGTLRDELVAATPQLLEIAKAANKINPALGSTTFLYDSLARGIKRASPLILDNLGVVIKVGEAYQTFADNMGISVKEMTAAQKSTAVLRAALVAGEPLIAQAGDDTKAMADSWGALSANVIDAKNSLLSWLADAAQPVVEWLNKSWFGLSDFNEELAVVTQRLISGRADYSAYTAEVARLSEKYGVATITAEEKSAAMKELVKDVQNNQGKIMELSSRTVVLSKDLFEAGVATAGVDEKMMGLGRTVATNVTVYDELGLTVTRDGQILDQFGRTVEEVKDIMADAAEEFKKRKDDFIIDPFGGIETGIAGRLEGFMESMDFALAGGQVVADMTNAVNNALFEERITEEQARTFWEQLFIQAQLVEVQLGGSLRDAADALVDAGIADDLADAYSQLEDAVPIEELQEDFQTAQDETQETLDLLNKMGETNLADEAAARREEFLGTTTDTISDIQKAIEEEFNLSKQQVAELTGSFTDMNTEIDAGKTKIGQLEDAMNELDGKEITVTVNIEGQLPLDPGDTDGTKGDATGGQYEVPPGFPSDTYRLPLKVSSGEVITITPPHEAATGGIGGGDTTIHMNAPTYLNSEANLTLEEMVRMSIPQYNA